MKNPFYYLIFVVFSVVFSLGWAGEGDATAGRDKSATCSACHGETGNSIVADIPVLAGQHATYLREQMKAYQAGEQGGRFNAIMTPLMQGLTTSDIENLAAFYEQQKTKIGAADPKWLAEGEAIYRGGILSRHVPACAACHGPQGLGNSEARFPRLSGQHPAYVVAQLKQYQSGARKSPHAAMMMMIAQGLTDKEMQALASVISGLH